MNRQVELFIKSDAEHGECPCWHQKEKLAMRFWGGIAMVALGIIILFL